MDIVKDLDLKKKGDINMDIDKDLDLVEKSEENETEDDFGFYSVFGYTEEEYNEEWN